MHRLLHFLVLPILVGIFSVPMIRAQVPPAAGAGMQFDKVSIKPCLPADGPVAAGRQGSELISPVSLSLKCRTVKSLIQEAFINGGESSAEFGPRSVIVRQRGGGGLLSSQTAPTGQANLRLIREPVVGGPDWLGSDLYTIEAKSETPKDPGHMTNEMLQAILEERFHLSVHRDTTNVSAYVLSVDESGPRLRTASEGSCVPFSWAHSSALGARPNQPACGSFRNTGPHAIEAFATMANLCEQFSAWLGRNVADKTDLIGMFRIKLPFSVTDLNPGSLTHPLSGESGGVPSVAGANPARLLSDAAQALGLKLEIGSNSSDVLVIDRVTRPAED